MRDGSGKATNFEVSQTLPFPTKLTHNQRARNYEAKAEDIRWQAQRRETQVLAKLMYFKLWKAQQRTTLLKEKLAAIEQHLKLSRAVSRSDSFLKIHLLKAENDLDLLLNEIMQAEQELKEAQIKAAEFLDRDPTTFRFLAAEFAPSEIPKQESLRSPSGLEVKRLDLERLKAREAEAKAEWFPDLNLRYREMGGTPMTPRSSEVMLGATLPFIFFSQPSATSGKASTERSRGEFSLALERRKVDANLALLGSRALALKKQLDQIREKLLPNAEKRMHLVHNIVPRDMEALQDHREAFEALPELKLKALELREKYEETIAELEIYSSGELK